MTTTVLERPAPGPVRRAGRLAAAPEVRWAVVATALLAAGGLAQLAGAPRAVSWPLYLACCAAGGWEPARDGLRALRERTLDVDLLMVVAAALAAAIGQVLDAALLVVIFATSGALEALATRRTADSVGALLDLAPAEAVRLLDDGTERVVPTAELVAGDVTLVRPGGRIGCDGVVLDGVSEVDQASLTGEPLPVLRRAGDEVLAGSVNGTGALRVAVARPAAESVVARVVEQVAEASATKARTQLLVETVEQRYSVGMVVATVALLVVPLALGAAFEPTLLRAITFMIVASPCALVLATMPPLLATIANAGRHGVLVRSAVVVERLGRVDVVALDKTGTLTEGTPVVTAVHVLPGGAPAVEEAELLRLAAGAERPSEHPVGAAVVRAAGERGVAVPPAAGFASEPGRGVRARVAGRDVAVGAPVLLAGPAGAERATEEAAGLVAAVERGAGAAVVVLLDGRPAGVLALADRVRPGAAAAVADLAALSRRPPVLLTGDNAGAARRVGAEVGITDVHAGLLPADKVDRVRELERAGLRVAVVGDGVNDAPALAAAHVGLAMGRRGADLALETADAVVVRDELGTVAAVVALSRRAHRVVVANLVLAGTVIVALVAWDLLGTLPLPLAVAGHEGSTVLVALNGLRLLRSRAWPGRTGR